MTTITPDRLVTRESACFDRNRPIIVTLHPRHIEVRPKGTRQHYVMSYDGILWLAVKRKADEELAEKKRKRDEARKARRIGR